MDNNYLYDYVKFLLDKNDIKLKDDKTCNHLTQCIENIIFNVVSIASIITFINNCKIINKESIKIIKKYLDNKCDKKANKKIGGGGSIVLPSEFYGIDSLRYSATNGIQSDILRVDFAGSLLRPQIGGGKKSKLLNKPIVNAIQDILNYYKLKASKETINKILKLIEDYIKCLIETLKEKKGVISILTIKKMMKSNKLFDIFK